MTFGTAIAIAFWLAFAAAIAHEVRAECRERRDWVSLQCQRRCRNALARIGDEVRR